MNEYIYSDSFEEKAYNHNHNTNTQSSESEHQLQSPYTLPSPKNVPLRIQTPGFSKNNKGYAVSLLFHV